MHKIIIAALLFTIVAGCQPRADGNNALSAPYEDVNATTDANAMTDVNVSNAIDFDTNASPTTTDNNAFATNGTKGR